MRDERYFIWLRYRGSDGSIVELSFERARHKRVRWWWRFDGETQWWGGAGHKSKLDALLEAAHERGMTGAEYDAKPIDTDGRALGEGA